MVAKISIGEEVYQATGNSKLIEAQSYSIFPMEESFFFVELFLEGIKKGIIIVGKVRANVDSLLYTKKYGGLHS